MNTTAAPRLVLLLKSGPGTGTSIAHKGGYALYGNPPRWRKITADAPAPKGAPVAAHPKSAGHHEPAAHFSDDQWAALKLPDSNVNAPVFNKALEKLKAWSDAGDVTAIVGASFGSNTYGQKLAKIANHLLGLHGSKHTVTPGQKPGTHAAAQVAEPADPHPTGLPEHLAPRAAKPEPEPAASPMATVKANFQKLVNGMAADGSWDDLENLSSEGAPWAVAMVKEALAKKPAPAAASGPLAMPAFEEGATTTGVKAHYEHIAQKVIDHGHAGNGVVLEDMKADGMKPNHKGKVSNTWAGKTANSKKLLALHAAAVAHAKGGKPDGIKPFTQSDADTILSSEWESKALAGVPLAKKEVRQAAITDLQLIAKQAKGDKLVQPHDGPVLVAHEGGQPVAALSYKVHATPLSDKALEVRTVGSISPGAGKKLMDKVVDEAKSQGIPVHLQASSGAMKFYEGMGFVANENQHKDGPGLTWMTLGGPNEGDTKPGADPSNTLVFKNGHWVLLQPEAEATMTMSPGGGITVEPAVAGLSPEEIPAIESYTGLGKKTIAEANAAALSGDVAGLKQLIADISQPGDETYKPLVHAKKLLALLEAKKPGADLSSFHDKVEAAFVDGGDKAAAAVADAWLKDNPGQEKAAKDALHAVGAGVGLISAQHLQNLQSIPWFKLKLPAENTNAKSHNAAIAKIEAMAFAGDKAGLQAFIDSKAGAKQTYAKKQALTAQTALAALGAEGATAAVPVEPAPVGAGVSLDGLSASESKFLKDAIASGSKESLQNIAKHAQNPALKTAASHALSMMAAPAVTPPPAADPYPLVNEWKAAIVAGKVPTKAQAEAFDTLGDADPDAQQEYFMDAVALTIPRSVPNHGDEFDNAFNAANNKVHELHGHALAGTKPAAPAAPPAAAPAKKLTPAEKKLVQIDPDMVQKWLDAKTGEAGPYSEFFEFVGKANKTKFHKWASAAKSHTYNAPVKLRYTSNAICSLFGKHDHCLLSTGEFLSIGAGIPAGATVVTDVATIKDAVLSGKKPDAPVVTADTPLGAGQLASLESLSLNELKVIQNGPGLGANVLAWIDKKIAELSKPAAPAAPAAPVQVKSVVFHNTTAGHNKFWSASLQGSTLKTQYGKIGSKGQSTVKEFGSPAAAVSAYQDLIDEKKAKGYQYQGQGVHLHDAPAAAVEQGPKEGDTKRGADGMLVLKNGHWVKMEEAAAPAQIKKLTQAEIDAAIQKVTPSQPHFSTNAASNLAKSAAKKGDGPGMAVAYANAQSKGFPKTASHIKAVAEAMGVDTSAWGGGSTPTYASASEHIAAASTVPGVESIDGWKKTGQQEGYNDGAFYTDGSGQQWYCKFSAGGEDVAKSEMLALKLYEAAGLATPTMKLVTKGGKVGTASKVIAGLKQDKALLQSGGAHAIYSGFAADAWLANWDTVGNNPAAGKGWDNIQFGPDGTAYRIDAGGALAYKGAGGKKSASEWGNDVVELKTLLDSGVNANTAKAFGKMSPADLKASVAKVIGVSDYTIQALVDEFGPGGPAEKQALTLKLIARKKSIANQHPDVTKKTEAKGSTEKVKKEKPDPTNLKVDASLLPKLHDFMNWGGTGKPISDKPYVQQNIVDEQAILAFALKGNLVALKDYKFQPVDKMTGQPTGAPKPISEHPSAHVKSFYDSCVNFMEVLANPPEPLRTFSGTAVNTVAELAEHFAPFDYGKGVGNVPANQRLGFWIALGAVADPAKFKPKVVGKAITAAKKAAAYENWKKLPKTVKTFLSAVQGSGSANQPYRDGKETDSSGQNCRQVLADCFAHASEHDEGFTVHKWMSMPDSMIQQFLQNPEGLVFQNPGSMCTSRSATGTSGFGEHRVTIHYAKGAKGMDTFGSGSFAGEQEITTIPGSRFMVLKREMVPGKHGGSKRLELEVLMLPPDPGYIANLGKVPTV